jgi:hypothetical protein
MIIRFLHHHSHSFYETNNLHVKYKYIQGDSGGRSIFREVIESVIVSSYKHVSSYRDRAVWVCLISRPNSVSFDEGPSHHSLKAFCATPMKMMRMSSFFYQVLQLMEHQWNEIDRGKPTIWRKTCLSTTLSTTNLTWTWPGTEPRASAVRGRRLTAWALARPNSVIFLFVGLDEERSLQNKVGYTDELLARILYAAACIKKREDQLRRTTRDLSTRVAKYTEGDGGIFEHLLRTVTNLSFKH